MFRSTLAAIAATGLVLAGFGLASAKTPEELCQQGRLKAAAKFESCIHKDEASSAAGGSNHFFDSVSRCLPKYQAVWVKLQAHTSGTGASCDAPRFVDNGNGTVTDHLTGLQWEKKTDDASIHDKDNVYAYSATGTASDGDLFTTFLASLNGACFAGRCDWRLPTIVELVTTALVPCTAIPCIDQGVFGPTDFQTHFSSSPWLLPNNDPSPLEAMVAYGIPASIGPDDLTTGFHVRAVRGSL